jgi:hypothetical protein
VLCLRAGRRLQIRFIFQTSSLQRPEFRLFSSRSCSSSGGTAEKLGAATPRGPTFTSRRDVVAFNAVAGSKGHGTRPCAHLVGRLAEAHAQATRGARLSTKCLTSARCHSSRTSARYRGNVRDAALKSGLFEAHALHHNPGRPQRAISKLPSARFVAQACRPMSTLCSRWRCCHCAPSRFSWACT